MKEIEIKAHVADRNSVISKLNSFAKFLGSVVRDDTYWGNGKTKIRVRREKNNDAENILVTYKKKENRTSEDGVSMEVNEDSYAGFDSETFLAEKYNLGLVDWTVSEKSPVWESSFSDYEKRIVQTGVTARYKIKIAEDGEVTIGLLSLVTQ